MNAPISPSAAEQVPIELDVEAEISKLVEEIPKPTARIENDVERIRSSVTRLASNSIEGLEGLTSELQELQKFLKSEVERVQSEIESALAGIKIIIEAIAPWKNTSEFAAASNKYSHCSCGPSGKCKACDVINIDWGAELSRPSLASSWVERDLQRGDMHFLTGFAFFRNRRPPSIVVDRLCERGFLAKTARARSRMTLKGWVAIVLRHTFARRERKARRSPACSEGTHQ